MSTLPFESPGAPPLAKTPGDEPDALEPKNCSKAPKKKSTSDTLLGCPRKLGSMVSKWVITYL